MGTLNLGRVRGTMWHSGTGIGGSSTTPAVFPGSGITAAYVGDMYLNTSVGSDSGNIYRCTTKGDASTAEWVYAGALKVQTELVNNLTSTATDKALTANQGRVLREMIEDAGFVPLYILPKTDAVAYTAQLTIKNENATITVETYDGDEGTYSASKYGTADTNTVFFTVGNDIGLSATGAAIREIHSTVPIYDYKLFDADNEEIAGGDPSIWDRINEAEENIQAGDNITDGTTEDPGETVKQGLISKVISGIRTKLWPVTHAKAVWFNESDNETVWDTAHFPRGTAASGDLNNYITPGTWGLVSTNTYTNLPTGVTSVNGNLSVFLDGESGFITQLLSVGETARQRFFNGSSWSAWKAMSVSSAYFNTFDELVAYANALGGGGTFTFSCAAACAQSIAGDTSLLNSFGIAYNQQSVISILLQTGAGHLVFSTQYNKTTGAFTYRYPIYVRKTESHTYNGLTITAERMGGFVRVKIAGKVTTKITGSGTKTMATLSKPFRPTLEYTEYKIGTPTSNGYLMPITITTAGAVNLGAVYKVGATTATDIPVDTQPRIEAAYISTGNLV